MNDEKLSALREQIDEIDRELVELFQKRMRAAERIAEVKISANLPLSDTTRERQVIETAVSRADNENISDTAAFMQWLINISKNRQRLCASRASGADFSSNSDNRYTIAIIGLGLIGGSLAYALSGFRNARIIGVDTNEQTRSLALTREAVDRATDDVREAVTCADLVILCLHPEQTVSVVKENAEYFKSGVFVTDVCGVKEPIVQRVRSLLPDGVAYVPCHPMAGKESGGFENARPDLFLGVGFAITPLEDTSREDIDFVEKLARYIGAEHIKCVTPSEHDALIAYTSHMPQIVASALCAEPPDGITQAMISGAFRDVTRMANVNAALWSDLIIENSEHNLCEIDEFQNSLEDIKIAIRNGSTHILEDILEYAGANKRKLIFTSAENSEREFNRKDD